jgi:hypothetical protein
MARILQALVNIRADIADKNETGIAFAHADVVDSYAVAVTAVHLIAGT